MVRTLSKRYIRLAKYYRRALSKPDRRAYIDAVLCLQSKSTVLPSELVPGARSRYDDFVATHVNQTFSIHFNVSARAVDP